MKKPEIELTDAKWRLEDDWWFVVESGETEVILSSDGDTVIATCGANSICAMARNILAILDNSGALDEYLRSRTQESQPVQEPAGG